MCAVTAYIVVLHADMDATNPLFVVIIIVIIVAIISKYYVYHHRFTISPCVAESRAATILHTGGGTRKIIKMQIATADSF